MGAGIVFGIMLWVAGLFIVYIIIKSAIDNSRNTAVLNEIKVLLRDIKGILVSQDMNRRAYEIHEQEDEPGDNK